MDVLNQIVGVQEAAEMWGLSPDHVKRLCRDGVVVSKKIGNTWVVLKDQINPKQKERIKMKIKVEKVKKFDHIIGEEWELEYSKNDRLDFLEEIGLEFVDADELEAVERQIEGEYVLDSGDFVYYVSIKTDKINDIISSVENGETGLVNDYDFHEMDFTDGASEIFIQHHVEGHEEITLLFAEHDFVKEMRDAVYAGEKEAHDLDELIEGLNDLEDQFDYYKVVGYRIGSGQITWI